MYKVSNDLTYAIVTGYNGSSKTVRIADTYLGLPVTEFSYRAFGYKSIISVIIPDSVTSIGDSAFEGCNSLKMLYYKGTAETWNKISIEPDNYNLTQAARYYYSETKPTESDNFWHYDENGNIAVW